MELNRTKLEGVYIIDDISVWDDSRGNFFESYNIKEFNKLVGLYNFVQDNESISHKNVIRGLHYQYGEHAQAKLVRVISGSVLDVIVDIQVNSPTFGEHIKVLLSGKNKRQVMIPRGFAHGFLSLEDDTIFSYKCDNFYHSPSEMGIRFDSPVLNIDWDVFGAEIISDKDLLLPNFSTISF
jgi:dTDP-4-dehydrorhamnose 3,5-epimerase